VIAGEGYKAILFDLDDTLVDFKTAESKSLQLTYEEFYQDLTPETDFRDLFHTINKSLWKSAEAGNLDTKHIRTLRFEEVNKAFPSKSSPETIAQFYLDKLAETSEWIEGAEKAIQALSKSHKLGIITNGFSCVQRKKYTLHCMHNWIPLLVISEEVGCAKPDKRIFHWALEKMGCTPDEVLMVGDSLSSDFEGAMASGIDFCWINPQKHSLPPSLKEPKFKVQSVLAILESAH